MVTSVKQHAQRTVRIACVKDSSATAVKNVLETLMDRFVIDVLVVNMERTAIETVQLIVQVEYVKKNQELAIPVSAIFTVKRVMNAI